MHWQRGVVEWRMRCTGTRQSGRTPGSRERGQYAVECLPISAAASSATTVHPFRVDHHRGSAVRVDRHRRGLDAFCGLRCM